MNAKKTLEKEDLELKQKEYFEKLIEGIKEHKLKDNELNKYKVKLCKQYNFKRIPTDIEVLLNSKQEDIPLIKRYLVTKPTRTGSGVCVVAIMTKPERCPHGKCTFCPGGPDSFFGDVPQSYTGHEPATMRAIRNKYDAYLQVMNRLEQYIVIGQNPEKVELIIMGGTFPAMDKGYQEEFCTSVFAAMNDFTRLFYKENEFDIIRFKEFFELPGDIYNEGRQTRIHEKLLKIKNKEKRTLIEEQKKNETAIIRCIGMTIETKPDWGFLEHGNEMLKLGCTRVELGVQTVYDEPLHKTNRGHDIKDTIRSIQELKDLGFKLNFHMMPGLPGVTREQDLAGLKQLFTDPDFKPDMLKIYPCVVMPGTPLFLQYQKNQFKPMSTMDAARMIADFKRYVPEYCRIMRVQRDIPTKLYEAGVSRNNLRQYIDEIMKEKEYTCKCIRCMEAKDTNIDDTQLNINEYESSGGKEFFISINGKEKKELIGFIRLRYPSKLLREEMDDQTAIIRELHVYSQALSPGKDPKRKRQHQHRGYGKKLMEKAEQIAIKDGKTKMLVISGIGVREYYTKLGYDIEGPYMAKKL